MRICLISREYPTEEHTGGIATYTEKTARALARLGQHVTVITESGSVPHPTTEWVDGVALIRLPPPQNPPGLVWRARNVAHALDALLPPQDIVQACEYRAEAFWYALHKRERTRLITRLATPTSLVEQLNSHDRATSIRTHIVDRLERLQTRRSDAIISPTGALAEIACRQWHIPRDRVATVRTGVEFAQRYGSHGAELPAEMAGTQYVMYFGRLEERKGVHILAQALPEVLARHPQLHAVFVGNVQSYHGLSLQSFIERCNAAHVDRLHFFPRLSQSELAPLLAHARFAVLPSLWENLANTCLEALDMGKPVVATLGCGFSEVIEEGRSGMLVPPGDVSALREAMLAMLSDPGRLARMSAQAKVRAAAFSQDAVAQDLLRFYKTVQGTPAIQRRLVPLALPGRR